MTSAESARRLAEEVRERMEQLGLTQMGVTRAGGPGETTLRALFKAAAEGQPCMDFQAATQRKFDRGLQWEDGSTRDTLAGGRPRPLPDSPAPLGVIRGHDPDLGEWSAAVPRHVIDAWEDLDELERAEAEAETVAHLLAKIRQLRAARPTSG